MINKVYEEIKTIIKENYKFFIVLILTCTICTIELPYYIEAPGGIINIEDRIEIKNAYNSKGSLNMAYVSGYKATIPTVIVSKLNKNWNLTKKDTSNENMATEADYFRNHILLEEANQNAIEVAYTEAGIDIKKTNTELYVTYVYEKANTNLEIKDKIIKVNNHNIYSKEDLKNALNEIKTVEDSINITVENNGKEINRTAKLVKYENNYILGVAVSETSDIQAKPNIKFNFKKSESGPSGGLMMALAIYNALTETDITNGKKIVGTGTIDKLGNVGAIDGVEFKLKAAVKEDADIFLVPANENYNEAIQIKQKENYKINIVPINTFKEAIEYLKSN